MKFKTPIIEKEFLGAPLLLRMMLIDANNYSVRSFDKELTITRIKASIEKSSGVHRDYRGADCRDEYCDQLTFTPDEVKKILDTINERYKRNDGYESVIHHSFQGGPKHFHFQIAALTKAYMPKGE